MVFILWSSPNHTPIKYKVFALEKVAKNHMFTLVE